MALTFLTISLYAAFLTISFSTASFNFLNQQEQVSTYQDLIYILLNLFRSLGTFSNLSISNLSASAFKLVKSAFF